MVELAELPELIEDFSSRINKIFSLQKLPKKIAVALSGGADSLALTLFLQSFCRQKKIELVALTVDHKMRKSSSSEALAISKLCKQKKIFHQILEVDSAKLPQSNIEAKLRELRFAALYDFCSQNQIEFLFLGHQLDDVAENFLIRLFRGSGLDGLAVMNEISNHKKIKLVRPLLSCSKDDLKNFLRGEKISWFEDETNADEKFLRNKIRNFLSSFDDKNVIQNRIKNAAEEIAEMRDLFDDKMLGEASQILEFKPQGYFLLNLEKFQKTNKKIALKILALILMEVSGEIYKPRLEKLQRIYDWIVTEKNHRAKNFYGCIVEKYDAKRLVIYREVAAIDVKKIEKFDQKNWLIDGRFLFEGSEKKAQNLVFLNGSELKRIKGLKGIEKKISATIMHEKSATKITPAPVEFYFRTILQKIDRSIRES